MTSARHGYVGGQWVAQPAYKAMSLINNNKFYLSLVNKFYKLAGKQVNFYEVLSHMQKNCEMSLCGRFCDKNSGREFETLLKLV